MLKKGGFFWTNYKNLKSLSKDLVELRFAHFTGGEAIIPQEQLYKVVNIDETYLILDGSKSGEGIRPDISFHFHN